MTDVWIDEAETITWDDIKRVQEIMDANDVPHHGRKLLAEGGYMVMDDLPPVFRPYPAQGGGPRTSKHIKARKQRHDHQR